MKLKPEPWTCATCEQVNRHTNLFCGSCGEAKQAATPSAEASRSYLPPWERPGFQLCKPDDPCTEPGCTKRVRDHIAEFRSIAAKPNTVLSRPSQREQRVWTLPDDE